MADINPEKDQIMQQIEKAKDNSVSFIKELKEFLKTYEANEDPIIYKKTCKICNSELRSQVEEMHFKNVSIARIHDWFQNHEKGEKINYLSVRNHLQTHTQGEVKKNDLKTYIAQLEYWGKVSVNDYSVLSRHVAMLDKEVTFLLASSDEVGMSERRKNIETASKVSQVISSIKEQLRNLNAEKRPVELLIISLNNIIKMKLANYQDPAVRSALAEIIDDLKKEVGDLSIFGESNG